MTTPDVNQAIAWHQAGRVDDAAVAYERLLAGEPWQPGLRHNLGMIRLNQQRIAPALDLLERAFAEDGANANWFNSLPLIGMRLYELGLWEAALHWLERSAVRRPGDPAVQAALDRIRPRSYLAPEVFDPGQGVTLLRHAPRESASYVYAIDVVGTCNLR